METTNLKEELVGLIGLVASRDKKAFERLYQLTSRKMFAVALRIVREPGMAQDVLQDAYIRLWRYAHTFNGKLSAPETWIHQIVRNRALDLISQQSYNVTSIPIEEFADDDSSEAVYGDSNPVGNEQGDLKQAMTQCMSRLEGKYRQVLTLAYNHGMSHAEIATHLEVPLGTVKTWARRGLLELRAIYDQYEAGLDEADTVPSDPNRTRSGREDVRGYLA